jgi:hypothetical protein
MATDATLMWPFGEADVQNIADAATMAVTINNRFTIVNIDEMAQAGTLDLTINGDLPAGAILLVKAKSDGTARTLTFGTGMTGTSVAGVISKTKYITCMYDGSKFIHVTSQQVD